MHDRRRLTPPLVVLLALAAVTPTLGLLSPAGWVATFALVCVFAAGSWTSTRVWRRLTPVATLFVSAMVVAATASPASVATVLLLGGAGLVAGSVVDLAAHLRTQVSSLTVRSIAWTMGGLTIVLVAVAGAIAAGTLPGTAARIGLLGVLLAAAAALMLRHGLRGLERAAEVSEIGGLLATGAVAFVLAGALLAPTAPAATALSLVVLLTLVAPLGAVTGLCVAAAVVRGRVPRPSDVAHAARRSLSHAARGSLSHIARGSVSHIARGSVSHIARGSVSHIARRSADVSVTGARLASRAVAAARRSTHHGGHPGQHTGHPVGHPADRRELAA